VYSREIGGKTYTFEPSGGLLNASLVMQDKETDSYWSIINEEAIHGAAKGQRLEQIPGSEKTTWGDWKRRYPHTKVLSVRHRGQRFEHDPREGYATYFRSDETFRGIVAKDKRLDNKDLLFSFHHDGKPYAVPFKAFDDGGATFDLGGRQLLLYRRQDDSFYRSTVAFLAPEGATFKRRDDGWVLVEGDRVTARFDPETRTFDNPAAEVFHGFDTYWYIWSLTNPKTEILGR